MPLEALPYYQNALLFYQEVDDPVGIEITQGNIALNLWRLEQGLEAIERMEISKAIRIRLGLSTERQDYYLVRWREWLANTE